jgi:hypothetical protein
MILARAQLSAGGVHLALPVDPYTANWGYQENTSSTDTIGGRVVQLLSVQVQDLTVTSVAGSRRELQRVADGVRGIMQYHVKTSLPAHFRVPSRRWDFRVYLTSMPQVGWDVASTTYPYQLGMAVQEDVNGVKSAQLLRNELNRLKEGIGYQKGVHGGDEERFTQTVNSLLKATSPFGDSIQDVGSGSTPPGLSGINPDKSRLTPEEIAQVAAWAFGQETSITGSDLMKNVIYAVAVCLHESGGGVGNNNPNATNGTAYGLWQGNATNGITLRELQTAEGNARWMAREVEANYTLSQSDNPYALRTWEHSWWAYWGAFRSGTYKESMGVARDAAVKVLSGKAPA